MVLIGIRSISMNSFTLKKSRINDIPIAMSTTNAQTPWFQKANPLKWTSTPSRGGKGNAHNESGTLCQKHKKTISLPENMKNS